MNTELPCITNMAEKDAIEYETYIARKLGEIGDNQSTRIDYHVETGPDIEHLSPREQSIKASRLNSPDRLIRPSRELIFKVVL